MAVADTSQGRFITLEGGEGAGKSTQITRLAARLRAKGISIEETREPGGTEGADAVRSLIVEGAGDRWDAVSEGLLLYAARRDHVERRIKPALAGGSWVLCDRFSDSTMAYQGYAHGLGKKWVSDLDKLTLQGFRPDFTIVLDLPIEIGLKRAAARGGPDRFEKLGTEFHEALREGFLEIARSEPDRVAVIDADAPADDIEVAVFAAVAAKFSLT